MKKNWLVIYSVVITAALVATAGFAVSSQSLVRQYEDAYQQSCRNTLFEVSECLRSIDNDLSKSIYARSNGMMLTLSNDIWRQAELAKRALASLPVSDLSLDRTSGFLSQVGAYCFSLSKKAAAGGELSDTDRAGLTSLSQTASKMADELSALYDSSVAEGFFGATPDDLAGFSSGLSDIESALPESPTLIYDGPYSDHITKRTPVYVQKGEAVSQERAGRTAADFLGGQVEILYKTEDESNVLYCFGQGDSFVTVTGIGGHILGFYESTVPGEAAITNEDAAKAAEDFLGELGYDSMVPSYFYDAGGICYINFAYSQDGVICYPDLIQVGVSLDSGRVTYLNAEGYLNNHTARELSATLSLEQASALLPLPSLEEGRLCIVPSQGENELLCYEFLCADENGRHYLFYINAKTGDDEVIFILIEDQNGTLTV